MTAQTNEPSFSWEKEQKRPKPHTPVGLTIPEAFLYSAKKLKNFYACADDALGPLTYKKIKRSVLVLAKYFERFKDQHIAVMLPACSSVYVVILALLFAKKIPVMLNWTLGPRYLEEMMKISGATTVITSKKFIEKLSASQLGSISDRFLFLEDVKKGLSLSDKLTGMYYSFLDSQQIGKRFKLEHISETDPCVILFTSGSESSPKGVPLSHKNILSNHIAMLERLPMKYDECMIGTLPPFHSFGFSAAGLFAFTTGVKIAFYPDPKGRHGIANAIKRWKVTMYCSAPTFLKGLFFAACKEDFKTLRLLITGAEKAPKEIFESIKAFGDHIELIEAYGITECSLGVTINQPGEEKIGLGKPFFGVHIKIIHPESLISLPVGNVGEICISGPSVFKGYIGRDEQPFIIIDNQVWYKTGDLGCLDANNNLTLSGRLKRFVKIGGEMISLGAIEEAISNHLIKNEIISKNIPSIAVSVLEGNSKPKLVLFSIVDLDQNSINDILRCAGFSNLIKISYVKKIDEIPLLGSGKLNLKALQELSC